MITELGDVIGSGVDALGRGIRALTVTEKGLLSSCRKNDIEKVKTLLDKGVDVNACGADGKTALILASWRGSYDIVDALIRYKADVNAANHKGWTGLMRAVLHGHCVTAGVLLENGADKNKKNKRGKKALDILRGNHKAMKKFRGKKVLRLLGQEV